MTNFELITSLNAEIEVLRERLYAAYRLSDRHRSNLEASEAAIAALKNELEEWKDESAANLELAKQTQLMVWEQSADLAALKIESENSVNALSEVRELYAEAHVANVKIKAELSELKKNVRRVVEMMAEDGLLKGWRTDIETVETINRILEATKGGG